MEHRWHNRDKINLDVMVYYDGIPIACGETKNLSVSGTYISPATTEVSLNSPVEVEFLLRESAETQRYRLAAQVIHNSRAGTGLMFKSGESGARGVIEKLLSVFEHRAVS